LPLQSSIESSTEAADIIATIVGKFAAHITVEAMLLAANKISFHLQHQSCTDLSIAIAMEQSSSHHMVITFLPSMGSCQSSTAITGSSSSFTTSSFAAASIAASELAG
jgi:hypothetical protein